MDLPQRRSGASSPSLCDEARMISFLNCVHDIPLRHIGGEASCSHRSGLVVGSSGHRFEDGVVGPDGQKAWRTAAGPLAPLYMSNAAIPFLIYLLRLFRLRYSSRLLLQYSLCLVHLQTVSLARRFALVPLGPPLLAYKSSCKEMITSDDADRLVKMLCIVLVHVFKNLKICRLYRCGPRKNSSLVLNYGFVHKDNPFDRIYIDASLDTEDPKFQEKRMVAQRNGKLAIQNFNVFNEISSREMEKINVVKSMTRNYVFMAVLTSTVIFHFQLIMLQFLGEFANTAPLTLHQWLASVLFGLARMPMAAAVKLIPVGSS